METGLFLSLESRKRYSGNLSRKDAKAFYETATVAPAGSLDCLNRRSEERTSPAPIATPHLRREGGWVRRGRHCAPRSTE